MNRKDIADLIAEHGPTATLGSVLSSLGFECPACAGHGYKIDVCDDPITGSAGMISTKIKCGVCGGSGSTEVEMVRKVVVTEVNDGWVAK